jgi:hypothetical protein
MPLPIRAILAAAASQAAAAVQAVAVPLAAAVALVACGSVVAPPASGPHSSPAGGPHSSSAGTPMTSATRSAPAVPGPPAGSRAQAAALARQLRSRLRLPPGTRRLPHTPVPASLAAPAYGPADVTPSLDQYQLFALTQPMAAAAAFLAAHVPPGLGPGGTASGSGPFQAVSYLARPLPAGIAGAQVVLTVVPAAAGGGSLLRADAQVTWYPARTAAEYIDPGRYHVLRITVSIGGRRPHTVRKLVTSRAVIARLAGALDRMQAAPSEVVSCPAIWADYQLAFSVSRQSRPVVVVSANQDGCGGAGITVNGRTQPALDDHGTVAALVDQVVTVTWEL